MKTFLRSNWKGLFYGAIWIVATIFSIVFWTNDLKLRELYRLTTIGVKTQGIVTDKIKENHQRVKYSFRVDGVTYVWGGFAGDINKKFDQVSIGEVVPIVYEPNNPQNSAMGDPISSFYNELAFGIFASLMPTFAALVFGIRELIRRFPNVPD
jgi:hypothetical protein